MDRNAQSRQHQHRKRIERRARSTDSMQFFNVLTSEALLEATEALSPQHRERLYPPADLDRFYAELRAMGVRHFFLVTGGDNSIWIALLGTNKLGRVDPATGSMQEFILPAEEARPRRLQVGADGTVWYTDYGRGYLGALDPRTGVREVLAEGPRQLHERSRSSAAEFERLLR